MGKTLKKENGITLIALIITIIVLLILAGITIGMLTSNNGVLKQGTNAREETIVGKERDQLDLAYNAAAILTLGEKVKAKDVQDELDKSVGVNKTKVTENYDNTLKVLFLDTKHVYTVEDGQISRIDVDDTNDGFYIGDKKILSRIYVPTDDYIISDIICKSGVAIEKPNSPYSYYQKCLTNLAVLSRKSDYLNLLNDLGFISQDYASFVKTEFLDELTTNDKESAVLYNNHAPMFLIQKTSDNKYKLLLEWDYEFGKQGATLYQNKAHITSDITFLNNDLTKYELGNLKVENSAFECNTTKEAPFGDDLSKYTNANNEIENFSIVYNGKKYEGISGLKQFLDNVVGFKDKENISRYADLGTYVNNSLEGNYNEEEIERVITKYEYIPPVKNANIVSKYMNKSNTLDGVYIKGERLFGTARMYNSISQEESAKIEWYYSCLFQLWNKNATRDFKPFEYFLNKQLIDPSILNIMLKAANTYQISATRVRNVQNQDLTLEACAPNSCDGSIPITCDITIREENMGEIMKLDYNIDWQTEITIGANDEVSIYLLPCNPESMSLTFFNRNEQHLNNFKWDDFRKNGLLSFVNEKVFPLPDKPEFWTIVNKYASENEEINSALSKHNNNSLTKLEEVDLFVNIYRSIVLDAFENGTYEFRQNGKKYTGKNAIINFLIENYGLDNASKVRELVGF